MTSRASYVILLAPISPPCFSTRSIWVEYLKSAAEADRDDHEPGPLKTVNGEVRFNYEFTYCADCQAKHSLAMTNRGLCKPDHLKHLAADLLPAGASA